MDAPEDRLGSNSAVSRFLQHGRFTPAGSTGRRNTGVKFLCRGFKSQGLAWPLIVLAGYFVEMGLRVHRQVGSFRKILSQQAIGAVTLDLCYASRVEDIVAMMMPQRATISRFCRIIFVDTPIFALIGAPVAVVVALQHGLPTHTMITFLVMIFATGLG